MEDHIEAFRAELREFRKLLTRGTAREREDFIDEYLEDEVDDE